MDKEVIDKFFELLKKANEENNEKAIVDLMKLIGLEGNINELEEDVVQEAAERFINRITSNEKNIEYIREIGLKEENISTFINFIDSFNDEKDKLGLSASEAYTLLTKGMEYVDYYSWRILKKYIANDENLVYQLIVDTNEKQRNNKINTIEIINSVQNPTQEFVYKCITNISNLSHNFKAELIKRCQNLTKEFVDKCIKDDTIGLSSEEKIDIIFKIPNLTKEMLLEYIKDGNLQFNSQDKASMIMQAKGILNEQDIYELLTDSNVNLSVNDKRRIILGIPKLTKEMVDKYIKDDTFGLRESNKAYIICKIPNLTEEQVDSYLKDDTLKFDTYERARIICQIPNLTKEQVIKYMKDDYTFGLLSEGKVIIIIHVMNNLSEQDIYELLIDPSFNNLFTEDKRMVINSIPNLTEEHAMNLIKNLSQRFTLSEKTKMIIGKVNNPSEEFLKKCSKILLDDAGITEGIDEKVQYLLQMYKKNDDIFKNIDCRMLDERYVQTLGLDKINTISCFPSFQSAILNMDEKNYRNFSKILNLYLEENEGNNWEEIFVRILRNISQYEELLSSTEDIDINRLITIMQESNIFQIKTEEQLLNFEEIKRKKCDEIMREGTIGEKYNAICYRLFGHSSEFGYEISKKYGKDINSIESEELKTYVKCLQEIFSIQDQKLLQHIYDSCKYVKSLNVNITGTEQKLKSEYAKQFNEGLLTVDSLEEIEPNVYDAGADFKMIITAIGAFNSDRYGNDYKSDWNRPKLGSSHFCTSYIRNDMLGTAPIRGVCYGFNNMAENALVLSRFK